MTRVQPADMRTWPPVLITLFGMGLLVLTLGATRWEPAWHRWRLERYRDRLLASGEIASAADQIAALPMPDREAFLSWVHLANDAPFRQRIDHDGQWRLQAPSVHWPRVHAVLAQPGLDLRPSAHWRLLQADGERDPSNTMYTFWAADARRLLANWLDVIDASTTHTDSALDAFDRLIERIGQPVSELDWHWLVMAWCARDTAYQLASWRGTIDPERLERWRRESIAEPAVLIPLLRNQRYELLSTDRDPLTLYASYQAPVWLQRWFTHPLERPLVMSGSYPSRDTDPTISWLYDGHWPWYRIARDRQIVALHRSNRYWGENPLVVASRTTWLGTPDPTLVPGDSLNYGTSATAQVIHDAGLSSYDHWHDRHAAARSTTPRDTLSPFWLGVHFHRATPAVPPGPTQPARRLIA